MDYIKGKLTTEIVLFYLGRACKNALLEQKYRNSNKTPEAIKNLLLANLEMPGLDMETIDNASVNYGKQQYSSETGSKGHACCKLFCAMQQDVQQAAWMPQSHSTAGLCIDALEAK